MFIWKEMVLHSLIIPYLPPSLSPLKSRTAWEALGQWHRTYEYSFPSTFTRRIWAMDASCTCQSRIKERNSLRGGKSHISSWQIKSFPQFFINSVWPFRKSNCQCWDHPDLCSNIASQKLRAKIIRHSTVTGNSIKEDSTLSAQNKTIWVTLGCHRASLSNLW